MDSTCAHDHENKTSLVDNVDITDGVLRRQIATQTDQMICHCQCDEIAKYKEKAHRSFMQVVQIEELYSAEIQQLKQYYEEKERTQVKKAKCKQEFLQEKCREYERQIEKLKDSIQNNHINQLDAEFQLPFISQSIQTIHPKYLLDQSTESINHLKKFVSLSEFKDNYQQINNAIQNLIQQLTQNSAADHSKQYQLSSSKSSALTIQKINAQVQKIIEFMNSLYALTNQVTQKYNQIVSQFQIMEGKLTKKTAMHQSSKKDLEFMTQHFKKVSQDKVKFERKCNELDRVNRNLQENMKKIRKQMAEKTNKPIQTSGSKNAHQIKIYNDDDSGSGGTIVIDQTKKQTFSANKRMMTTPKNDGKSKAFSRALNFHRKNLPKDSDPN